jgi:hypothetical protein
MNENNNSQENNNNTNDKNKNSDTPSIIKESNKSNKSTDKSNTPTNNNVIDCFKIFWYKFNFTDRIQIILACCTVCSLIFYIIFGFYQNYRTRQALEFTKKAVILSEQSLKYTLYSDSINKINDSIETRERIKNVQNELRAYVNISSYTDIIIEQNKVIEFKIEIFNSGKTPAFNIITFISPIIGIEEENDKTIESIFKEKFSFTKINELFAPIGTNAFVGSNQHYNFIYQINPSWWDSINYKRIIINEISFNIFGRITYNDIFNEQHITQFYIKYIPDKNTFYTVLKYNEAT